MKAPSTPDRDAFLVGALATSLCLIAFLFILRQGTLLLYGDAVAHINIARRVFDSRTPGLLQLGTVWLPLPHLLMIPFLLSDSMWQSGIGGSIPSLAAYVFGVVGIFRLVRETLTRDVASDTPARVAAWLAAAAYAANPNLLYLATTAMTESLYLALFVWALVYFSQFVRRLSAGGPPRGIQRSLRHCGLCLAGAAATRYDGWFVIAVLVPLAFLVMRGAKREARQSLGPFLLIAAAVPALWLAYNAAIYRNPLEFANGPYSARAIEQKSGASSHPGAKDLKVASVYFLKSVQLSLGDEGYWQKLIMFWFFAVALLFVLVERRWLVLLLALPLPFYVLSIAYGGVPIYVPQWWPYGFYNTRYGLELLPAFAASVAVLIFSGLTQRLPWQRWVRTAAVIALVAWMYSSIWRAQPIVFREAWINSHTRVALERELAKTLERLPNNATILMYLGDHPGAVEQAGIPLRRVIHEGNHRTWRQPADPEGLWERALADPSKYADFVVAISGDPVAAAVSGEHLTSIVEIHVSGQPNTTVYQARLLSR